VFSLLHWDQTSLYYLRKSQSYGNSLCGNASVKFVNLHVKLNVQFYSHLSNAEVKNEWSYASAPPVCHSGVHVVH
jgi:hypothetical protein